MNAHPTPHKPSPRGLGRSLLAIAGALLMATLIVRGESWAIQAAPPLIADAVVAASVDGGCAPDNAEAGAMPVAVLH